MQLFKVTKIDFMGKKWLWIAISAAFVLHGLFQVTVNGIAKGVEFTGGAQIVLKYPQAVNLNDLRNKLEAAGLRVAGATTFGGQPDEVSIRVGLPEKSEGSAHVDLAQQIVAALRPDDAKQKAASGLVDINEVDQVTLADRLVHDAGLDQASAETAAKQVSEWRKNNGGLISSLDQAQAVPGLPDAAKSWIASKSFAGPFAVRSQDILEGSVSAEMRKKAMYAMFGALVGMLIYIWVRFQFIWGLAAILALAHDVIATLGLFILFGYEADLPVVAAFLTLVGFSVNDTIVTFDRIRENLRNRGGHLSEIVNASINQTLSRTVITSLTVFLSALCLYLFGGPVLNPFAFVMTIGIVVGTYSSIYIASPVLVIWKDWLADRAVRKDVPTKARA